MARANRRRAYGTGTQLKQYKNGEYFFQLSVGGKLRVINTHCTTKREAEVEKARIVAESKFDKMMNQAKKKGSESVVGNNIEDCFSIVFDKLQGKGLCESRYTRRLNLWKSLVEFAERKGYKRFDEFGTADIVELIGDGVKNITWNDKLSTYKEFFVWCLKDAEKIDEIFGSVRKRARIENPRPEMTFEEIVKVASFVKDADLKDLIWVGAYTGARLEDCVMLKKENMEDGILTYIPCKTKNSSGKRVEVAINDELRKVLEKRGALNGSTGYVFPELAKLYNSKKGYISNTVNKAFKKVNPKFSFACLRPSFVSNMARNGVSPLMISNMVGHTSVLMTSKYARSNKEDLKNAANTLGKEGVRFVSVDKKKVAEITAEMIVEKLKEWELKGEKVSIMKVFDACMGMNKKATGEVEIISFKDLRL